MGPINRFTFPDIPQSISDHLFKDEKTMIVIGVIGKSFSRDCNKMAGFNIMNEYSSLISSDVKEGNITFYYEKSGNILFVHFETTFDNYVMQQMLEKTIEDGEASNLDRFTSFHSYIRTRFAKILLFATQICHLIVLVEPGNVFDASYLSIFKSLKIIREKYVLKFLPKILKNSVAGQFMGKEGRLCSPRFLFFFEKPIDDCVDDETIKRLEYDVEDEIYKILRNEFIITNNTNMSLFSIPRNKRFVYFNTDRTIRNDPLKESIEMLVKIIDKSTNREEEDEEDFWASISPYKGFAKPYRLDRKHKDEYEKRSEDRSFMNLLKEHVEEALQFGFDDSMAKFRGKSHFTTPNIKVWYESFKILHKIFIENPDNVKFEPSDPDYKAYLDNFHKIMDVDESFFTDCSEHGLDLAKLQYNEMLPHHYSSMFHEQKLMQATDILLKYARGPDVEVCKEKLRDICTSIWLNGKQQCEFLSLRGNPCVMGKHTVHDHESGVVYVATCNCGRTQGRREDPYTVRAANFEFYQLMEKSCPNCNKLERVEFPVFEPSTTDFRAAEISVLNKNLINQLLAGGGGGASNRLSSDYTENIMHLSGSQKTQSSNSNISIDSIDENEEDDQNEAENKIELAEPLDDNDQQQQEVNEKVVKAQLDEEMIARQVSTTEYLDIMVHTKTPEGLLPQFPSWSLVCIGASSIYSHNTGIPEHVQSGFLSGANFLLPWDVHIGLESSWAVASYEKSRHHQSRKKGHGQSSASKDLQGKYCNLKIFIGVEYECPRGHRFIMNSPTTVLRGSSEIERDCGNKVVYGEMPIYFACPCRSGPKPNIAQLMRIHIVTPKAPVNILIDPKVKIFGHNGVARYFSTGLPADILKLSQSTYWILRFPYVYQDEDGVLPTPVELPTGNPPAVLLAGMYGIKECE